MKELGLRYQGSKFMSLSRDWNAPFRGRGSQVFLLGHMIVKTEQWCPEHEGPVLLSPCMTSVTPSAHDSIVLQVRTDGSSRSPVCISIDILRRLEQLNLLFSCLTLFFFVPFRLGGLRIS